MIGLQDPNSNDDSKWYMNWNARQSMGYYGWSNSWTVAGDLKNFLINTGRGALRATWYSPLNYGGDDLGNVGDVTFYDWGQGLGISPSTIQVAYGQDVTYSSFSGPLVDQHTNPRYHAIWTLAPTNTYWQTTTAVVVCHN